MGTPLQLLSASSQGPPEVPPLALAVLDAGPVHLAESLAESSAGDSASCSDSAAAWRGGVLGPALAAARAFLSSAPAMTPATTPSASPWAWGLESRECGPCGGKVLRGPAEWEAHVRSRAHRKRAGARGRKRARDLEVGGGEPPGVCEMGDEAAEDVEPRSEGVEGKAN